MKQIFVLPLIGVGLLPGHAEASPTAKTGPASGSAFCANTLANDHRSVGVTEKDGGGKAYVGPVRLEIGRNPDASSWKIDDQSHVICTVTVSSDYKFAADRQTFEFTMDGTSNSGDNSAAGQRQIEGEVRACITRTTPNTLTFEFYRTGPAVGNVTPLITVFYHATTGGKAEAVPVPQTQPPSSCPAPAPAPAPAPPSGRTTKDNRVDHSGDQHSHDARGN